MEPRLILLLQLLRHCLLLRARLVRLPAGHHDRTVVRQTPAGRIHPRHSSRHSLYQCKVGRRKGRIIVNATLYGVKLFVRVANTQFHLCFFGEIGIRRIERPPRLYRGEMATQSRRHIKKYSLVPPEVYSSRICSDTYMYGQSLDGLQSTSPASG